MGWRVTFKWNRKVLRTSAFSGFQFFPVLDRVVCFVSFLNIYGSNIRANTLLSPANKCKLFNKYLHTFLNVKSKLII